MDPLNLSNVSSGSTSSSSSSSSSTSMTSTDQTTNDQTQLQRGHTHDAILPTMDIVFRIYNKFVSEWDEKCFKSLIECIHSHIIVPIYYHDHAAYLTTRFVSYDVLLRLHQYNITTRDEINKYLVDKFRLYYETYPICRLNNFLSRSTIVKTLSSYTVEAFITKVNKWRGQKKEYPNVTYGENIQYVVDKRYQLVTSLPLIYKSKADADKASIDRAATRYLVRRQEQKVIRKLIKMKSKKYEKKYKASVESTFKVDFGVDSEDTTDKDTMDKDAMDFGGDTEGTEDADDDSDDSDDSDDTSSSEEGHQSKKVSFDDDEYIKKILAAMNE